MNTQVIKCEAPIPVFTGFEKTAKVDEKSGIKCEWTQYIGGDNEFRCEWNFNWEALEKEGAKCLRGNIRVNYFDWQDNSEVHEFKALKITMNSQVITYSTSKPIFTGFGQIQVEKSENGIDCQWKQYIKSMEYRDFWCEWFFDWTSLKNKGAERVEGAMTVTLFDRDFISETHIIDVNMNEPSTKILKLFDGNPGCSSMTFAESASFSYEFTVFYGEN